MEDQELKLFWHPDNDGYLEDYPRNSTKKILWRCPKFPDLDQWEMSIVHMRHRKGCPFCSGRRVNKRNALQEVNPKAAMMWNKDLNSLSPSDVTAKSSKRVWWKCEHGHAWEATVYQVNKGHGCPYCSNQKIGKENCFAKTHPEVAKELLDVEDGHKFSYGSQKKVWWLCDIHGKYEMSIANRTMRDSGCQQCAIEYRAKKKRVGALEKAYRTFVRACTRYNKANELGLEEWSELVLSDCSYCGDPPSRRVSGYNTMINGIDRIDNDMGYLVENVTTCCWRCNKMKGTMSKDDFLRQVNKIGGHIQ